MLPQTGPPVSRRIFGGVDRLRDVARGFAAFPLVRIQNAADSQQHSRVGFFQLGPGLRDAIDLRQNFRFIRLIRGRQGSNLLRRCWRLPRRGNDNGKEQGRR